MKSEKVNEVIQELCDHKETESPFWVEIVEREGWQTAVFREVSVKFLQPDGTTRPGTIKEYAVRCKNCKKEWWPSEK